MKLQYFNFLYIKRKFSHNIRGEIMRRLALIFAFICIFAMISMFINYGKGFKNEQVKIVNPQKIINEEYILKSQQNKLYLYKSNKLIKHYDISPATLPLTDQDNLRTGIRLSSYEEVLSIIEDFGS